MNAADADLHIDPTPPPFIVHALEVFGVVLGVLLVIAALVAYGVVRLRRRLR